MPCGVVTCRTQHPQMVDIPEKLCPKWEKFSQVKEKLMTEVREKTCPTCNKTKPSKEFKRRLSLAQSRAVLRNPNVTTNYIADSKHCKSCQKKAKPPRLLTDKEIRNRITNGDLRRALGEAILDARRRDLPERRSRALKVAWAKTKGEPIRQLKLKIGQQVAKYAKRHYASPDLKNPTQELNKWNYAEARRVRDELVERIDKGEHVDPDVQIEQFFRPTPVLRERIRE